MSYRAYVHIPSTSGHFLTYGLVLAIAAKSAFGSAVAILPADALKESVEYFNSAGIDAVLGRHSSTQGTGFRRLMNQWVNLKSVAEVIKREDDKIPVRIYTFFERINLAYLLSVFITPRSLDILFSMRADLGQHNPGKRTLKLFLKAWHFRLIHRTRQVRLLLSNDPVLVERFGSRFPKLRLLPDFSTCPPAFFALKQHRISLIGAITPRKGLVSLLKTYRHLPIPMRQKVKIRLCGVISWDQLDTQTREEILTLHRRGDLELVDHFLDSAEYLHEIQSATIIWVNYEDHNYASGVVLDAIRARKIIIAQSEGVIGWYARKYSNAILIDRNTPPKQISDRLATYISSVDTNRPERQEGARDELEPAVLDESDYVRRAAELFRMTL